MSSERLPFLVEGAEAALIQTAGLLADEQVNVIGEKEGHSAAKATESYFRELLEALPAAVYTTDTSGRITFYNKAAADLWGRRPELGKSEWCGSWRLYWPDGKPMAHDQCPMAITLKEKREIRGAEAVAERPDGSRVHFIPYPTLLYDSSGNPAGAVNMLVDITERQRADEYARRLALIIESCSDSIVTTDVYGIVISWNQGAKRLFGYTAEEMIGKPFMAVIPEDRHDEDLRLSARIRRGDRIDHYETVRRRKDGTLVEVSVTLSPVKNAEGMVIGASRIARDITERRRAEEYAQRLASIVESSDDAVVSKDLNGIIMSWNTGAQRLFGYTAEEVIGKPITILIPADRENEEPGILERIRRGERIDHYETVRRRKDGSLVDIALTVSSLRNAEGRVIGASKIARDITERKRAREQRYLLLREMNHRTKNLFSVASAVVALSARFARTPEEIVRAIRERLTALARAHELTMPDLTQGQERTSQPTTISALLQAIAAPFRPEGNHDERITAKGPDVPLSGSAVTGLSLLLHEFATNAAKYGALSSPSGRVSVDWSTDHSELVLTWMEQGGPPIHGQPESEGFGSLLARTTASQFGGQISREWNPEGLTIRLSLNVDRLKQ